MIRNRIIRDLDIAAECGCSLRLCGRRSRTDLQVKAIDDYPAVSTEDDLQVPRTVLWADDMADSAGHARNMPLHLKLSSLR